MSYPRDKRRLLALFSCCEIVRRILPVYSYEPASVYDWKRQGPISTRQHCASVYKRNCPLQEPWNNDDPVPASDRWCQWLRYCYFRCGYALESLHPDTLHSSLLQCPCLSARLCILVIYLLYTRKYTFPPRTCQEKFRAGWTHLTLAHFLTRHNIDDLSPSCFVHR